MSKSNWNISTNIVQYLSGARILGVPQLIILAGHIGYRGIYNDENYLQSFYVSVGFFSSYTYMKLCLA